LNSPYERVPPKKLIKMKNQGPKKKEPEINPVPIQPAVPTTIPEINPSPETAPEKNPPEVDPDKEKKTEPGKEKINHQFDL